MKINELIEKLKKQSLFFIINIIIIFSLFIFMMFLLGMFNEIENRNMDNFENEYVQYEEFKNKRMVC
jgi:hypothetical protein